MSDYDVIKSKIQEAIFDMLMEEGEQPVRAKKWNAMFFLKCGKSFVITVEMDTRERTEQCIATCAEYCQTYFMFSMRVCGTDITFMGHEMSHGIPVPAKEK